MNRFLPAATAAAQTPPSRTTSVFSSLLPIALAVFVGFLLIGMQLPVLPLYLHDTLGMGTAVIGLVIGAQFAAALLSRSWAGNIADMRGPRRAVLLGFVIASLSGLPYLVSVAVVHQAAVSTGLLLLGRVVLALGESLIVTGALGWGIGLLGPRHAGRVMSWMGMAMYGAYAFGAPLGVAINSRWGFGGVALACLAIPLPAILLALQVRAVAPSSTRRTPFYTVLGSVWRPGLGLALSSVGFGVITAFIALTFAVRQWGDASLAFTVFGLAFIGARILFGHLPDTWGGARVALVCVLIEAAGQGLIVWADSAVLAYVGIALTGFGYSLAFPGFGVEAVRRAPPQARSLAMGAYVAFLDLSLALISPLAGLMAARWGLASVYGLGAATALMAFAVAAWLLRGDVSRVQ